MLKRAMLYCQHLAGIGHLVRSTELARSMSAEGWDVLLVCGGRVPQNYEFPATFSVEQLPAIHSDPEYKSLFVSAADVDLEDIKKERRLRLLEMLESFQPHVLITELFPFGRKQFAFELLPLLEQAKSIPTTPLVVASVRDILVRKRDPESHERRVLGIVNRLYDVVLVHSDDRFQRLQDTFESAKLIGIPVVHTGYIVASHMANAHGDTRAVPIPFLSQGEPFILVSCGSGRLHGGRQLIHAVLQAAPLLERRFPHKLLICAGPLVSNEIFEEYQHIAAEVSNVHLIHDLPWMRSLLGQASLSLSLGGYNTVMELLAARAQGLVFAAEPNGDNEQKIRVESLSAKGLLREIRAEDLMDGRLSELISGALTSPLSPADVRMNGVEESTSVLKHYLELRHYERFPDGSHEVGASFDTTSNHETTVHTPGDNPHAPDGLLTRYIRPWQHPSNAGDLQPPAQGG